MNDMKRDFFYCRVGGFVRGKSEIGGVPKVRQWMRLKPMKSYVRVSMGHHLVMLRHGYAQLVRVLSSDLTCSASI